VIETEHHEAGRDRLQGLWGNLCGRVLDEVGFQLSWSINRRFGAGAFISGDHLMFGVSAYETGSRLLAHEPAHVGNRFSVLWHRISGPGRQAPPNRLRSRPKDK